MQNWCRIAPRRPMLAGICLLAACWSASAQVSVRKAQVLGSKDAVEIEIEASDRIVPQTQVLTGPDRLVIDFPNAVPASGLRSQSVYRGQVKDLRVGLFQSKPPITRIVLDLNSAQSYQIFPGRTVIIKVMGAAPDGSIEAARSPQPRSGAALVTTNYVTRMEPIHADPRKPLEVSFRDGLLAIHSNKATLSEVLFAVQQRTGAEVAIAAGAEQEKVVVDLGPGAPQEVLAQLLNGSRFNFLLLGAPDHPDQLERVILTPRIEGGVSAPPPVQVAQSDDNEDDQPPAPSPHAQSAQSSPIQIEPKPQPELKGDDAPPEQQ